MVVLIIGGTGLLGSEAAKELIKRGHSVIGMALPPVPTGADIPSAMELILQDFMSLRTDELAAILKKCDGLVFAAGVDERIEGPPPIYDMFSRYNIEPLRKLLPLAKACGIRKTVVCGSYFTYFDRTFPEWELSRHHPYIRSRVDQAALALSFADPDFAVSMLELPYIFGAEPGRKPVWTFLVDMIRKMPVVTMYPKGGTAMITTRQAGECIASALETGEGGQSFPVAAHNMTWKEMLAIFHEYMGMPKRKVLTIPTFLFAARAKQIVKKQKAEGREGGLDLVKFVRFMTYPAFMSDANAKILFKVRPDDIKKAIGESVQLSLDVLDRKTDVIDMKGE